MAMTKLAREWHKRNKMPKNATDEERMKWHIEHSKNCGCRPMSEKLLKALKRRVCFSSSR